MDINNHKKGVLYINYITEILKLLQLNEHDIDLEKTTISVGRLIDDGVIIHLYLKANDRVCPKCGSIRCHIHDTKTRKLYHASSDERKRIVYFHQRIFQCQECHSIFRQAPSFLISKNNNLTVAGELNILEALKNPNYTFSTISTLFHVPIMKVIRTFDKNINMTRRILNKVICFDEFYAKKLTPTKYCFAMYDPLTAKIVDILPSRRMNDLIRYFSSFSRKERLNVKFVNIDMWHTYKEIAATFFPNALICVDSFHVIEHLVKAIDKIRLRIQRKFLNEKKDNRKYSWYWLIRTFRYYLTTDIDNIKYKHSSKSHYSYLYDKYQVLEAVLSTSDDLREAYNLKEEYREFNRITSYEEAQWRLPLLIQKFKRSKFEEYREFGKMLERWQPEIINSFIEIDNKRMSNGPIESLNSKIKNIIRNACGFTNFKRFRNKAMYSLNKDGYGIKIK